MPRLPRVTAAEALRALRRDGWNVDRQSGSHIILMHLTRPGRVTIARHAGAIIKPKTLATILDQAGLTIEAFHKLL